MTNISKFIALILLGLSLSYCAKKAEETPAPDYVGELTGTYTGSSFKAIVEKNSGTEAKITLIPTSSSITTSTLGFNITYSNNTDVNTAGYIVKSSYFTIPTTSTAGFNTFGSSTTDYDPTTTGIQNAYFYKSNLTGTLSTTFYASVKTINGTSITVTVSK